MIFNFAKFHYNITSGTSNTTKSIINSLARLFDSFKRLFTRSTKVSEVHTFYEENGIKKEKVEVMK